MHSYLPCALSPFPCFGMWYLLNLYAFSESTQRKQPRYPYKSGLIFLHVLLCMFLGTLLGTLKNIQFFFYNQVYLPFLSIQHPINSSCKICTGLGQEEVNTGQFNCLSQEANVLHTESSVSFCRLWNCSFESPWVMLTSRCVTGQSLPPANMIQSCGMLHEISLTIWIKFWHNLCTSTCSTCSHRISLLKNML